jgi:glycosyltransferase involved in cell wall biosynthesis
VIKLTHIITTLDTGGAEMMLHKLLARIDHSKFSCAVIGLTTPGRMGERMQELGVPVRTLGMRRGIPNPFGVMKLARWLRASHPHVIQTWMYHADLIGGLANRFSLRAPLVWNIRHSNLDPKLNKRMTLWTIKACARFSHALPHRIVLNSEAARCNHQTMGYGAHKMTVIPNGFDTSAFQPDAAARASVRRELNISAGAFLIGMVGRFDPQKDHHNFVQAAGLLLPANPETHFLLCGEKINWENRPLRQWIRDTGAPQNFHLLGRREDVPRLLAALDIAASASAGESFANAVGEAMACGVPCVVTDAGDSALIVGGTGRVVPIQTPGALARAWQELMEAGPEVRQRLGHAARNRIEQHFSLPAVVGQYEKLYQELALCAA